MRYPLDGCAAKIRRGEEHLEAIDAEVQAFLKGHPYRPVAEFDPQSGENIVRVRVISEPSSRLAAIIGDCVHNLRSCLDHLAWQLVLANGEHPDSRTEFPVFKDRDVYENRSASKVRGIAPEMLAIIESLQPYNAPDPTGEPLWILHDLSRVDKHQELHVVGGTIQGTSHALLTQGGDIDLVYVRPDGPFEDGAVVQRVRLDPADAKVDVHFGVAYAMHFEPGGPARGEQVVRTLGVLSEAVTETVNRFRPPLQ